MQYVLFHVCLLLLSPWPVRFVHVFINSLLFLFILPCSISLHEDITFFFILLVDILGRFQLGVFINKTVIVL